MELGPKLLLATDQQPLIQDYDVLRQQAEVDQSIPVADRLLGRYGAGSLASVSFDKGFTRAEDRELLSLYVPTVVMPKRGKPRDGTLNPARGSWTVSPSKAANTATSAATTRARRSTDANAISWWTRWDWSCW